MKVSKVTPSGSEPFNGKWGFWIAFDNNTSGIFNHPNDHQNDFVVGEEAPPHALIKKTSKTGKEFFIIELGDKTQSDGSPSQPVSDDARQLLIVKQSSLKAAIDYHNSKGSLGANHNEILDTMEIFTECIMTGKRPMVDPIS